MKELMPIVHLTYREGLSSVFMAQVVQPMALVSQHGYPVTLAVCTPLGEYFRPILRRQWRERRESIHRDFGLYVRTLPSPPARARSLWDETPLLRSWLKHRFHKFNRVILHCRGPRATDMALRAVGGDTRFRVIFDCRGINGVELLYVNGYQSAVDATLEIRRQADAIESLERSAAQRCHAMICVSEAMKRYVVGEWSAPPEKISVLPCGTDVGASACMIAERDTTRQQLGLENKFVVAYCGSLAAWQMPMESLAIFQRIAQLRLDAHFLVITTQPERMETIVNHVGIKNNQRTIMSVLHTEVPKYLVAADVGLLIREPSPVNRVASPVKFAEYLACGVPVIISDGVGDYSEIANTESVGLILPYGADKAHVSQLVEKFIECYISTENKVRESCREVADKYLNINKSVLRYKSIYQAVFSK